MEDFGGSGGTTAPVPTPAAPSSRDLPEVETFDIELKKDNQGDIFTRIVVIFE